ncbi:putative protein kinase RLK-Pelle-CrRLK1L-1 family [Helianthus annuus]|uniref:Protein kinase domain-containing protein n=1 Tax=Helianthus annuus TaxID=4232 RepID=A0A9K3ELY7_HELAN|nr:putative protein kinase RLK-Pelle-CrRLK1L-1 family [Helianthus annuus]KAJ0850234.1 putative protein kinase RLK-Pelle-CrRLK1L-1 family [Helianthus annuus]
MEHYMQTFLQKFRHLKIQLEDITSATNNFNDNPIGVGGFGNVYKGEVSHPDGRSVVAIKRLDSTRGQGAPEFLKELTMLSEYKHENVISLLGFCCEKSEMILVYEHASRGSLDRYLNSPYLTWSQRIKICLDAAKGLHYLHDPRETHRRLIHCDVKSGNILLDEEWNAKVSDLGLSVIGSANEQHSLIVTLAAGTPGYIDPLYRMTHTLTKESDVYSFGVVLFEVLCGRLSCTYSNNRVQQNLLPTWIESYEQKQLSEIVFKSPTIKPMHQGSLKTFSDIVYQCLKISREDRPKMTEVVTELETALIIQELSEGKLPCFINDETSPQNFSSKVKLWELLCEGVLINDGKTWLSLNKKGELCEMISIAECLGSDVKSYDFSSRYNSRTVEHIGEKQPISDSDANWEEKLPADYEDIMKRSENSVQWTTKEEAYAIIRKGFLISDDKMKCIEPVFFFGSGPRHFQIFSKTTDIWFSLDNNGKKCHMISSTKIDIRSSHRKIRQLPESRFGEAVQLLDSDYMFIETEVQSQLVSSETTYACYLVYKTPKDQSRFVAPMEVKDRKCDSWYIYLASPQTPIIRTKAGQNTHNPVNRPKIKGIPQQRNDGWIEVQIWELRAANTMNMELMMGVSGTKKISRLIIEGIEFRPI